MRILCHKHNVLFMKKSKLGINRARIYQDILVCLTCVREARNTVKGMIKEAGRARLERHNRGRREA